MNLRLLLLDIISDISNTQERIDLLRKQLEIVIWWEVILCLGTLQVRTGYYYVLYYIGTM